MAALPCVLLLGDSIRQTYQPLVAEALAARADVVGPAENGTFSANTLACLDRWLDELGLPDIVHWNNGLHDIGHRIGREPQQYSVEQYLANLEAILQRLRQAGAKVIWATTTPIKGERIDAHADEWTFVQKEIDEYNAAARGFMEARGVGVNDLHAIVAPDTSRYVGEDRLHLSDEGNALAAQAAVEAIEAAL